MDASDLGFIAKVLAGRPKDIDDAAAIRRIHARELDRTRIRRTLALLDEALGQSDLLPAFEAITAKA